MGTQITDYRPNFERLWKCFIELESRGLGKRGNKKRARAQWDKLLVTQDMFRAMIEGLRIQGRSKIDERYSTGFCESFQHAERWIRDKSWQDLPVTQAEKADQRYQEVIAKHLDRSWAE